MIRLKNPRVLCALFLVAIMEWQASASQAQQRELRVDKPEVAAGAPLGIAGSEYCPSATPIYIAFEPEGGAPEAEAIGSFTADSRGIYSGAVRFPPTVQPGRYRLQAFDQHTQCPSSSLVPQGGVAIPSVVVTVGPAAVPPATSDTNAPATVTPSHTPTKDLGASRPVDSGVSVPWVVIAIGVILLAALLLAIWGLCRLYATRTKRG